MWSSIITEKFTVLPTFTHLSYFDNQVGEAREVVIMAYMWSTVTATKKLPRNPLTTLAPSPNPQVIRVRDVSVIRNKVKVTYYKYLQCFAMS